MNKIKITEMKLKLLRIPILNTVHKRIKGDSAYSIEDEYKLLLNAEAILLDNLSPSKRPIVGLVKEYDEIHENMYWPKYERFLISNKLDYKFINIKSVDFIKEVETVDIVVWRTLSDPASQYEAKSKIYFIEKHMHKQCLPSYDELWYYEDKIRQNFLLELNKIPSIPTYVFFDKNEAIEFVNHTEFPIISKITTGSGSQGVEMIKNKNHAKKLIDKVFGNGKKTYWTYNNQKNYVYFQKFIEGATFDLRVIVVDNMYFGYYRTVPKDDFRASGSGSYSKKEIPLEALKLAKKTKQLLPKSHALAIDFIKDTSGNYLVIETSIFITIDTAQQLVVDNVSGVYIENNNEFEFQKGDYWIQELALKSVILEWMNNN